MKSPHCENREENIYKETKQQIAQTISLKKIAFMHVT